MAKTVIALYDRFATANEVVSALIEQGFGRENISLVASDMDQSLAPHVNARIYDHGEDPADSPAAEGAGVGAGIGAIVGGLGGLLLGLGALTIPGIGPIIAAGPLAAALSGLAGAGMGAVAGGVTGGLLGALVDLGVPEEPAQVYAEGIRRGGTLVAVQTEDERAHAARDLLHSFNPINLEERAEDWRRQGWEVSAEPEPAPTVADQELEYQHYNEALGFDEDFSIHENTFRQHYIDTFGSSGAVYDDYRPAYRYGYTLGSSDTYRGRDWDSIEPEARREWERDHPDAWDQFKAAVRRAWEEVRHPG